MTLQEFSTLITNVGFPIALCLLMGYIMMKEIKTHENETDKLVQVIADNTKAIEKLQTMVETVCEYFVRGSGNNDTDRSAGSN